MTATVDRCRAARSAVLTAGVLATAGCSLVPVEENTFEAAPLPAIRSDGAERVLDVVDRQLSAANAARDPALLAEVVAGPLLDIDSARYALDSLADPDDADVAEPVDHRDPTAFIPRFEGYPQWFVVAAAAEPEGALRLEVLTRDSAGAGWLTLIAPELLPDVEFPVLALDDVGYVVPFSSTELGDLPIGAHELAEQHALVLGDAAGPAGAPGPSPTPSSTTTAPTTVPTTDAASSAATTSPTATSSVTSTGTPTGTPTGGGADDDAMAAGLAADPWTAARRQADAAAAEAVGAAATLTTTYDVSSVLDQALRTEDGGALVFYALTGERAYAVTATYFLQLDATTAAIVGKPEVTASLAESWAAQLAVYIPPDDDGAPRVVAARWDRVGLSGS